MTVCWPRILNNMAWLCARTGERVDYAIKLANRACEIEPESYAYIDTAASTPDFAAGKADEAVKLEKRALLMRPSDLFMQQQLARFEKASTS